MAVDITTYRIRTGCFMLRWTTPLALCNWTKGLGSKNCNMAFCVVMCMLLLCAGYVKLCAGPTQTRLTSSEAKSMQGAQVELTYHRHEDPDQLKKYWKTSWRRWRRLLKDSQG